MAKKKRKSKKSSNDVGAPAYSPERRAETSVQEAENGYIVRVCSEGMGKGKNRGYQSKTYVATDHPTALRIAAQGFSGLAKKVGKGKKGNKKRISTKQ